MSYETENNDPMKPSTEQQNTAPAGIESILSPDLVAGLVEAFADVGEAIKDIPLQLELNARVNLAQAFIIPYKDAEGHDRRRLDQIGFENAWQALASDEEDSFEPGVEND